MARTASGLGWPENTPRRGQGTREGSLPQRHQQVVAFGGGHGLFASLKALRQLNYAITAVVTVADDGGSSGRLRRELGLLPPGDLRQALVALASDDPVTARTADLFQYRFPHSSTLRDHAVGNLILAGLFAIYADPVAALRHAEGLLQTHGHVLPMSLLPLEIEADIRGLDSATPATPQITTIVRGQAAVAVAKGQVAEVRLLPADPPACPAAVTAVHDADWLIFGPGSWFTSVLPHLLVPELREAIAQSPARRVVTLNLAADRETSGLSIEDHLATIRQHDAKFHADVVLADPSVVRDYDGLVRAAESLGGRLVVASVAAGDSRGAARHDPTTLAAALHAVLTHTERR